MNNSANAVLSTEDCIHQNNVALYTEDSMHQNNIVLSTEDSMPQTNVVLSTWDSIHQNKAMLSTEDSLCHIKQHTMLITHNGNLQEHEQYVWLNKYTFSMKKVKLRLP